MRRRPNPARSPSIRSEWNETLPLVVSLCKNKRSSRLSLSNCRSTLKVSAVQNIIFNIQRTNDGEKKHRLSSRKGCQEGYDLAVTTAKTMGTTWMSLETLQTGCICGLASISDVEAVVFVFMRRVVEGRPGGRGRANEDVGLFLKLRVIVAEREIFLGRKNSLRL